MPELNGNTLHLNPDSLLPPVDCPLLIEVAPGVFKKALRETYVKRKNKEGSLIFRLEDGTEIEGRFRWTYP